MRIKLLLSAFVFSCCFTSCLDITEIFTLQKDGSGIYEQDLDFSRSMKMLSVMTKADTSGRVKEKKDTTFSLASIVDTSSRLTPEQKIVLRKAFGSVHVDEASNKLAIDIKYPFTNREEFNIIQNTLSSDSTLSFLRALNPGMASAPAGSEHPKLPTQQYMYVLSEKSIERKTTVNQDTAAAINKDDLQFLPEGFQDLMNMHFNTVINLPAAAKKWKGEGLMISSDKKTIKLSKELKLTDKPSNNNMAFLIQY
jgi:hypothetical protein